MGIVTVLLTLLLLSCIYDADSKTKLDDDDPTQNVGKLIETIKTILEIKNDIQRAYENVAKTQKSTTAKEKGAGSGNKSNPDDKDCVEIDAGTKPTTSKTRQPSAISNDNHSPPFKYSETVDKSAIGNTDHTKSTGVEIYDIISKQHNSNDKNSLKIQQAGKKNTVNKDIKKSGKTTEDVTEKISSFQRNQIIKIKLSNDAHSSSSKPTIKDSKKSKDSPTPTETDESQQSSAKVHSETNHNFKKEAVLFKSKSVSETSTDGVIMPINSQSTINILKGDTALHKTTKSVSETAKSERKTSKSPTNSITRNTLSVESKTTVPKKSTKGGVMSLDDLNSSNSDIILHKTSGPVNRINVIPKSPLSSTKQNGIMDDGQKKNIISSGSSDTNPPNTSLNGKTKLYSHHNTEPSITGSKPTTAYEALNMVPSHDDENPLSISRNSKLITGIKVDGNKPLLHRNGFSYTETLSSQQKGLLDTNEPVKHNISKSIFNTADENQSSSNKEFSWKGVSGKKNRSSPLSKDIPVSNDRINTIKIQSEQTQTEVNNSNHVSAVTRTDSPIKNPNTKRTSDSSFLSVKEIEGNLKITVGQHDNDNEILGKGHVTAEDKSNTKPKSFLDHKDPMLNENVREGTKKVVVGKIIPSIIIGNGRLATEAMESGQISMSPGLSNSNAFVVNTGPRFVNNQEHVPFSSDSIQKKDRKQAIDGLNLGQKKVSKLSDSNMPSNDDENSINSITTDNVPISKVANLPNVSAISNITKTRNIQVSKETNNQPKHNTVSESIVTGSFGIDQVVARNTLSARKKLDSIVPTEPKHANHLSKGTSINRNFFDQAVYGNRVQSINTLNVSPNEKTNTGNSIIINLKVHSNDENRFHNSFDKNDDSDFPKSGVSVKRLSTDSPVSSKTNGSLFVVTASLQSTPTKVRKARINKDKKKSFGTIFVPTKQMAGFVPMKTIVDPLEQFSKDKTEFTEDPEMKIKEKSDITERNISSGKATSMIPAGLTIQIVSSKKDENKHKSPKNARNGVSWKLKKTEQKAVITKPGTSESPTLSTATEKQHLTNMDSSNIENKPADLYENTHTRTTNVDGSEPTSTRTTNVDGSESTSTRTTNVDGSEPTSTRTTNVDGSEATSTKKQQIKMYSVHPGMVQSITNFENNRLLYNAFRKYKLASQKRQRRSISIPSFLQMRLDKPIKVYNNAYVTGKRYQNSIQIKGTNKVRKMFFEVPNNTHSKIETPTESYNDSKVLKTQPEIEVSLNSALENTKNPVYQSNSESLGVVIHQYTTEKPTLQKRKKSRHTKRHIKDRLFRRISKSLSNGLPIYSKANKESILEKKPTDFFPGNELSHGSGMRINLGNIQQTLQEKSEMIRSKDVLKVNKNKFPSKTFMSIDHNPVSKTKIRPKNIFYDTKFELRKSSNPADIKEKDNSPKQNNQWNEMPQSNLKSIFKTHQHDENKDNNDNNNNLFPVDTAIPLNRRKMPTYKFPFKHSNQMNDKPTETEEIKPTKILSYHSSDTSSSGLSSKPGKSFVYNPQQHHDSITDRTKFISGLSEFNDITVENGFPNFDNEKPSESNLNAHTDNMPSVNDVGTDQIEKSRLDPIRPNVINLSNIKIVPGGCIIEGRFYRYEDLPKFIQEFYDNKTKNEHLELSLGDVENVLNDYTENKGSISQSFSTEFPMLELIKGKDASPFSIQLPGDSQGYDILAGPHLHEGSRQLAVLQANNLAAGNERFDTPRTMVSRPDIHNGQTKIHGKENNRQLFNPVLKWSEGVSDKAGTGLAPIANYQVASDIRVVNSLSPGHFGAQNKNINDYRTYKLNGNSFGSYNNEMKEVISLPGMGIKDQKVLTKFFNPIHISSKQTVSLVQRKNSESPPSTKRPNEGSKLYLNDVNIEKSHQNKLLNGAAGDIILRGFLDIPLNSMSGKLTLSKALKKTANQNTQSNGVAKKLGLVRKKAKQDANSNSKADKLVFKNPVQDEAYHDAYANNDADKLGLKSPVQDKAIHDLHSNGVADKLSLMSKVKDKANQDAQLNGVVYKLGSKIPVQDKATLDVRSNGVADKLSLKSQVQDKANQDAQSNGVANKLGFSSSVRGKANKDAQYNDVAKIGLKNVVKIPAKHVPSERVLHSAIQEKTNYKDKSNGKADKLNFNKEIQENVHRDTSMVDMVSSVSTRPKDKYPHDMRMNSLEEKLKKHTGIHGTIHNDMWLNGLDGKPSLSLNNGIQNKNPNNVQLDGVATKKRLNSRKQDKTTRHDKLSNRIVSVNSKIPEKSVLRDIALKQNDKVLLLLKDNKRKLDHLNNNAFTNLKSIIKATSSAQKTVASHARSVKKGLGPRTFFDIIENNIISPFKSVPKVTHLKDNFASNFNLGEILKNGMSAFNYEPVTLPNFIAPPKRNLIISPTASIPLHLSGQHNLDTIMHEIVTSPFGMRQNSIMDIFG